MDKVIQNKINKFQYISENFNIALNIKTRRNTKLKFYKTMAVPILLHGNESWLQTK